MGDYPLPTTSPIGPSIRGRPIDCSCAVRLPKTWKAKHRQKSKFSVTVQILTLTRPGIAYASLSALPSNTEITFATRFRPMWGQHGGRTGPSPPFFVLKVNYGAWNHPHQLRWAPLPHGRDRLRWAVEGEMPRYWDFPEGQPGPSKEAMALIAGTLEPESCEKAKIGRGGLR
jgi:hypothetical protein